MDITLLSEGCKVMLKKMINQKRIGGRHTPECLLFKSIKHLNKEEQKLAIRDWHECIQEGFVLIKQKPTERHVSLNPSRINEVKEAVYIK